MKYIELQENDITIVEDLKNQMREVKDDRLPEFVSVFVGNVKSTLKKCSYKLQGAIKWYYRKMFDFFYKEKPKLPILEESENIVIKYQQLTFNFPRI